MEDNTWEQRLQELSDFRSQHGHCDVPTNWPEIPALGIWVANQRQSKKKGTLSESRIDLLEQLGFHWVLRHGGERAPRRDWEEMYQSLVDVHSRFKHSNVPYAWEEDPALGRWVQKQRDARVKGQLTEDQISRLNAVGIEWDAALVRWKEMFSELLHFKEIHGHCNVPIESSTWPKLANWIATQRRLLRRGPMSQDQVDALASVGIIVNRREQTGSTQVTTPDG